MQEGLSQAAPGNPWPATAKTRLCSQATVFSFVYSCAWHSSTNHSCPATPIHVTHVHTSPVPGPPVPQAPADQDVLLLPGAAKCQGFSPDVPAPFTSNWPFQAHGLVQNALPFVFNETGLRARACTGVTSFGRFACDQCAGLASCTVQEQYAMRASYPAESAALSHITNVWLTNAQLQCRHKHFKRQFDGKRFSIMNQTGLVSLAY
jgi:hypothetical protein